jgi:hypothetical protein
MIPQRPQAINTHERPAVQVRHILVAIDDVGKGAMEQLNIAGLLAKKKKIESSAQSLSRHFFTGS